MKSKISKILGVVVTVAVLASLMVTSTVLPASAAPGTLAYGVVDTPSLVGNVMVENKDISFMAVSPDGLTVFAYDDGNNLMYKSTNGGVTFAAPFALGTAATNTVGLVLSPSFATDGTVVLAETSHVWMSTSGGGTVASYQDVAFADLTAKLEAGGAVTSVDVGPYYTNNILSIIVGVTGGPGVVSNVLKFTLGSFSWDEVGAITTAGIGNFNVIGVKFSPAHMSDAEIMCVYTNVNTYLASKFGTLEWNNPAYPELQLKTGLATSAVFGVPSSYIANTGAGFVIGTSGSANDDLFYVTGRAGAAGTSTDKNASGTPATNTSIKSVSIAGTTLASGLYVGTSTGTVNKSTSATVSFAATTLAKGLTGTGAANVAAPAGKVLVGTAGTDSAFSVSTDGGVNFAQISLIDVAAAAGCVLSDLLVVDNNTMFLVITNGADKYLFKTTDAAVTWKRIQKLTIATMMVSLSPAYATDNTIVYYSAGFIVQKSVDGGVTFTGAGVPVTPTAVKAATGGNIYVGGLNDFYKVNRWSPATGITGNVVSIAISPADATGATIAVGTDAGTVFVSTNDGVSFTQLGTTAFAAVDAISVAYAADGTLFALGNNGTGINRWTGTAWSATVQAVTDGRGIVVTAGGALYAADNWAGAGIERSLAPKSATPEYQQLDSVGYTSFLASYQLVNLQVVSSATDNTLYAVESTTAVGTFGYLGRVYGFKDTFGAVPTLASPADATLSASPTSTILTWDAFTGAGNYQVQVATNSTFTAGLTSATGASTTYTAATTAGTTYYWRVRAIGTGVGLTNLNSPWSAVRSFIAALNTVPVATAQLPLNGATNVAVDTIFSWDSSSTPAGATYQITISESSTFTGATDVSVATNTYKPATALKYNTLYYWRVRVVTATSTSAWTTSVLATAAQTVATTPVTTTSTTTVTNTTSIPTTITSTATPVIPSALLWMVVLVGVILVIAVIVLIVRTRRIN